MRSAIIIGLALLIALAGSSATSNTPIPSSTHCDVAVVGGGSGGANAAVFLKDLGYNVCLFEQTAILGGHCNTFTIPDAPPGAPNWIELGVQIFGNTTWQTEHGFGNWQLASDKHLQRFLPPNSLLAVDYTSNPIPAYAVDLQHGLGPLNTTETTEQQEQIEIAYGTFYGILSQYPWLDDVVFPDPIPAELLVPFSQFIATNNLQALSSGLFAELIFDGGQGSYDDLTTLYALLGLRRGNLALLQPTKSGLSVIGGCGAFYAGVTKYLGSAVYFNATVEVALRPLEAGPFQIDQTSTLYVRINNGRTLQQFTADNIVIAIPQTVTNLAPFLPDLTELATFFDLETREYFALEFNVAGPAAADSFQIVNLDVTQPNTLPKPPAILDFSRTLPYGPSAGWASSNDYITEAEMVEVITAQLAKMPKSVLNSVSLTRIIQHVFQPFFPVSMLQCSPNAYRFDLVLFVTSWPCLCSFICFLVCFVRSKINNLQGYRNMFYVGAGMTFAESVKIWEHEYRLINANF